MQAKFNFTWSPTWVWENQQHTVQHTQLVAIFESAGLDEGPLKDVQTSRTHKGKKLFGQTHLVKPPLSRTAGRPCSAPACGTSDGDEKRLWHVGQWKSQPQHSGKMMWHVHVLVSLTLRRTLLVNGSFLLLWVC